MIMVKCAGCQKALRLPDTAAGKRGKCPACGASLQVPSATPAAAADRVLPSSPRNKVLAPPTSPPAAKPTVVSGPKKKLHPAESSATAVDSPLAGISFQAIALVCSAAVSLIVLAGVVVWFVSRHPTVGKRPNPPVADGASQPLSSPAGPAEPPPPPPFVAGKFKFQVDTSRVRKDTRVFRASPTCESYAWFQRLGPSHSGASEILAADENAVAKYEAVAGATGAAGVMSDRNCFSPDGKHLAWISWDGAHCRIVLDGRPGPPFNDIRKFEWSPDSQHLACVDTVVDRSTNAITAARVIRDGKRCKDYANILGDIHYSADSDHLAYAASTPEPGSGGSWPMVAVVDDHETPFQGHFRKDGTPNQNYDISSWLVAVSGDGSKLAYADFLTGEGEPETGTSVIENGATPSEVHTVTWLQYSDDGSRLYACEYPAASAKPEWTISTNAVPGPKYASIDPATIRVERGHLAYRAKKLNPTKPNTQASFTNVLVVDNKEYVDGDDWTFSPDGKHLGIVQRHRWGPALSDVSPNSAINIDGRLDNAQRGFVKFLQFSPSGNHYAYVLTPPVLGGTVGPDLLAVDGAPMQLDTVSSIYGILYVDDNHLRAVTGTGGDKPTAAVSSITIVATEN